MRFKSNNEVTEDNSSYYTYAKSEDYTKKDDFVDYPIQDFDLAKYFSKEQKPKNCKYNLYGVIHHTGTVSKGHYFATIKNNMKSNEWH